MPFLTDDQLKAKIASQLHIDDEDRLTTAKWDEVIRDSNSSAKNEILTALYSRGYSVAQVLGWDRLEEYQTDIALFWSLTKAAELQIAIPDNIKALDRRKELAGLELLVAGVIVDPDTEGLGYVGSGTMDTTDDHFTYDMDL